MPNQPINTLPRTWAGDVTPDFVRDRVAFATIATTGSQEFLTTAPSWGAAWTLAGASFVGKDALAQNDTNFITVTFTNKKTGTGTTVMLGAADTRTTATNPSAMLTGTGYNRAALPLSATAANLVAAPGDTIAIGIAATGTLANTVTEPVITLHWRQTA